MSGGQGQVKTYPVKTVIDQVYVAFEEGTSRSDEQSPVGSGKAFED